MVRPTTPAPKLGDGRLSGSTLRRLLDTVLPSDDELDAFLINNFPSVARSLAGGMDRQQKFNLLLDLVSWEEVFSVLSREYPDVVDRSLGRLEPTRSIPEQVTQQWNKATEHQYPTAQRQPAQRQLGFPLFLLILLLLSTAYVALMASRNLRSGTRSGRSIPSSSAAEKHAPAAAPSSMQRDGGFMTFDAGHSERSR